MTKARPPTPSAPHAPPVAPTTTPAVVAPRTPEEERQALLQTLHRLGFSPSPPRPDRGAVDADLWVRPPGTRTLVAPVFVEASSPGTPEARAERLIARWSRGVRQETPRHPGPSILVVNSDESAELAGQRLVASTPVPLPEAVSRTRILVHPFRIAEPEGAPHWHRLRLPPKVVLLLATGTLLGLAERAEKAAAAGDEGGAAIDIEGMFRELRRTFNVDVEGSLGVAREEDAMFLLYQLALRETYAPGDQGASLHELVNDPKGPAARLPWFAI